MTRISALLRFMDWPLRAKMAALLVVASVLPLGIAAMIDIRQVQERLLANSAGLLAARGDELQSEIDAFHRAYQLFAKTLARLPSVVEFSRAGRDHVDRLEPAVRATLEAHAASDPNLLGLAVLDLSGTVKIATEHRLLGKNLSYHSYVREARQGAAVISDVHLAEPELDSTPTIGYLASVPGTDGRIIGFAVLWVRAKSLWDIAKASNELAGPQSFAVVFDRQGVRIAHTYSEDIVFHPGGKLAPATVDALVAERRFGEKTRALLEDVRAFREQFDRARSESPDPGMFRGLAPVNQKWNYGVARRLETVPWTIFYMIPEESLNLQMAHTTRDKAIFAGVIMLVALLVGTLFSAIILDPIRSLSQATESIAGGDLAVRVQVGRDDELGRFGASFNSMAERIEGQAEALQRGHDELELRVQERTAELAQLAAIVESSEDAIMGKTLDGTITSWNAGAERMFGYSRQEALGSPILMILPSDRFDEEPRIIARVARGESIEHFETVRVRKDRRLIDVSVTISPIKDGSGRIVGASKIARDITERRLADEALRARDLAQAANRTKSEFLANMSHELRTPLNAIIGFTGTLLMKLPGPLNADQEKQLRTVQTGARHLLALINDLLDLAKIEAGKIELSLVRTDCKEIIEEVAASLRPQAESKGVEFTTTVPQGLTVNTDQRVLSQILINLANNAIKFTERGSVRIKAERREQDGSRTLQISVEDTGIGIRAEDQAKLFAAFSQVDARSKQGQEGSGLGLHLSRKLAEVLGGRIELKGEYGKGSTFTVFLPLVAERSGG